jgi:tRNA (cytidine/uridine-2'-O-)-methyltransferase
LTRRKKMVVLYDYLHTRPSYLKNTPKDMFHIALWEPRIPQNTGNIIRLAANNGCHLHLIEPLGFDLEEKNLRRSGLDYFDLANVSRYPNYPSFLKAMEGHRILALTTKGSHRYDQIEYKPGDVFLFGSETAGLPENIRQNIALNHQLRIPMKPNNRSINLSNTVAIVSYEAWRQLGFAGGQ